LKIAGFTDQELNAFKSYQRSSFDTLSEVGRTLKAGETEHEVTARLRKSFEQQGVRHYFHTPVALFGKRTSYPGNFGQLGALPTHQKLEDGMPVILDASPVYRGYTVDTSLSLNFGESESHNQMMCDLKPFHDLVLEQVRAGITFRAITNLVNSKLRKMGYLNCHRKHIGNVLGHRLTLVPDDWFHSGSLFGLGIPQVSWFLFKSYEAERWGGKESPNWNHKKSSDHPPAPGLWAVEPHIARDGIGVKFEEILVITETDAFWLDDDLPHHRIWKRFAAE